MCEAKPLLALTMGDPAGIGPELCLRALNSGIVQEFCQPVVFGDAALLERVAEQTQQSFKCKILSKCASESFFSEKIDSPTVYDFSNLNMRTIQPGQVSSETGRASYEYVLSAIELSLKRSVHALVTAPIHKYAWQMAGIDFPGHTELLEKYTDSKEVCMLLTSKDISCSLVTTHIGLNAVAESLSSEKILKVIRLTHQAMCQMHPEKKGAIRIGVLGLNPHNGEAGLFGSNEEEVIIEPAVKAARASGIEVIGPLVPDTAFIQANRDRVDAFVCMYHDQGLIPLKLLAFDVAVNVTLGLKIIRTSVDHGTALDIAWKGLASDTSLQSAIQLAAKMSQSGISDETFRN